ncbi:MAG: hypothetical protein LDL33_12535 [Desulfomonile sp.]|nr:hypothetical protein [Desulfomonile sp.]
MARANEFYRSLKKKSVFDPVEMKRLLGQVSRYRVESLTSAIADYLSRYVPEQIRKKKDIDDYRANPYVVMTTAAMLKLHQPDDYARFLFDNKFYMGLETSFGKGVEAFVSDVYPISPETKVKWIAPPEKVQEFSELNGMDFETKALARIDSVWREIDKSCVVGKRRYLLGIKSGPRTINDTQVDGMVSAIHRNRRAWWRASQSTYARHNLDGVDIILGLSYGTEGSTNNKENQVLLKLLDKGFQEEDRDRLPGVLKDSAYPIRIYRRVGIDFWATIGNPAQPSKCRFVFLEVLLGLVKAARQASCSRSVEELINEKVRILSSAISRIQFPAASLPEWVKKAYSPDELVQVAGAMAAFFDEGI